MKRLITVAALSLGLIFGLNAAVVSTASALGFGMIDTQAYLQQEAQKAEGTTLFQIPEVKKIEAEVKAAPQEYRVLVPEDGINESGAQLNAAEHVGAAGM
jgi:hypothetical protein